MDENEKNTALLKLLKEAVDTGEEYKRALEEDDDHGLYSQLIELHNILLWMKRELERIGLLAGDEMFAWEFEKVVGLAEAVGTFLGEYGRYEPELDDDADLDEANVVAIPREVIAPLVKACLGAAVDTLQLALMAALPQTGESRVYRILTQSDFMTLVTPEEAVRRASEFELG